MRPTDPGLRRFLKAHQVLTLAVTDETGHPHAAAVFYALGEGLTFYFLTDPATRHGAALARSGKVAAAIQQDHQRWQRIRGAQLRGRCRPLRGADRDRAWAVYCRRYRFLRRPAGLVARALLRMEVWELKPDWVRLIDNRAGLGRKREWRAGR